MKQFKPKGEWVRSSSTPSRQERIKSHDEFMVSELKKSLDAGYHISGTKLNKRPRIQKKYPRYVITIVLGKEMKVSIEDFNNHFAGFNKVREIY